MIDVHTKCYQSACKVKRHIIGTYLYGGQAILVKRKPRFVHLVPKHVQLKAVVQIQYRQSFM